MCVCGHNISVAMTINVNFWFTNGYDLDVCASYYYLRVFQPIWIQSSIILIYGVEDVFDLLTPCDRL